MDCGGSAVLWFALHSSEHLRGCRTPMGDPGERPKNLRHDERHLRTSQFFQISGSVSPLLWISCTRPLRVSIELGLMKGKLLPEPNSSSVRRHRFLKHVTPRERLILCRTPQRLVVFKITEKHHKHYTTATDLILLEMLHAGVAEGRLGPSDACRKPSRV